MDEVITSAINSINDRLTSPSWKFSDRTRRQLMNTCNVLNRLLKSNLPRNDWTRLFCRQLKRLMDYNASFTDDFWIQLHDDILFAIGSPNDEQDKDSKWSHFLERMKLESILEKREIQFQQTFRQRKSFRQLFCEHQKFFEEYINKCISLHSKIRVRDLIKNADGLLCSNYGLKEVLLTTENRERLEEKLKCIEITFDCSNRLLNGFCFPFLEHDKSYTRVNNNLSNFLPSAEQLSQMHKNYNSGTIKSLLRHNRWLVVLGDPGSAKTTLLRWIVRVFAGADRHDDDEIVLKGDDHSPVRIHILIRIGEFAAWLEQRPTKTLIDYVGKHTWFSEPYSDDDNGYVLKELIYHGHALILLDGLDEIPQVRRRQEIVDLIRQFVEEYVRAPDFSSAFDNQMFNTGASFDSNAKIVQIQSPSESSGNQIVITSRIVGYHLNPLTGSFIEHYLLVLMDHDEAYRFVNNWISEVEKSTLKVFKKEGIQLDENIVKILSKRRCDAAKAIFENGSKLSVSNPFLLSLICISIFQSPCEFCPKSRVEVYDYVVQSVFRSWPSEKSGISKSVLTNFLIDLATYIHLQSSSGLIDTFDMHNLCCLTLYQQGVSNDRIKLREYANKLISLVDTNIGIVSEQGLQVFRFLHLSFQEYFVTQSLVRGFSVHEIAERILTFAINPRFRESLLLALGWISWKRSFDDYNQFCNILVTPSPTYIIPFGILLFFDALNDLQRLPSNAIIFTALNNLLDHPSNIISATYFIENLLKLKTDVIMEWMQIHLKDEKRLFKFCLYFQMKVEQFNNVTQFNLKLKLYMMYRQLWSFHNMNTSTEFAIDQTFRKIMVSGIVPDDVFNNELSTYFSSHNICASKIHPLILSAIIAVCGEISFQREEKIIKIYFSPKYMHCESSIITQIIEYFVNKKDPHSVKVEMLIKHCESFLENCLPVDTSLSIVDTFITLICLRGLSQPSIYENYDGYQALPLALNRFKHIWLYLKKSYESTIHFEYGMFKSFMTSEVEVIVNVFFSQSRQSDEQRMEFSLACAAAWQKLVFGDSSDWFVFDIFRPNKFNQYLECQPEVSHSIKQRKLDQVTQNNHPLQIFQQEPFFLLNFVPQSLQALYYCMTIAPTNNTNSLPPVVLLSQSLILLEDVKHVDKNSLDFYLAVSMLQTLYKKHMLENYASVLFWENKSGLKSENEVRNDFLKAMQNRMSIDQLLTDQPKDWETLINVERQRIYEAKNLVQSHEKDLQFFAASISLARLFQTRYRFRKHQETENIRLFSTESKEVLLAVINILDPILRIIALNMILDMKDPSIFDEEQRDKLRWEIIIQLQYLLLRLPLLTSTLLFVRCHAARQLFSASYKLMASVIGEKLNKISSDKQSRDQEAAFIALQHLNNSDLSCYLSQFVKRTKNLSDLQQVNSAIFFRYFSNTTSFDPSNTLLISSMYLAELAFDVQILKMYISDDYKRQISPLKELKQLWDDSSKNEKIMTFKVAIWITNYLQKGNQEEVQQIIADVSNCLTTEKKALAVIEKWLSYEMNKDFRFFALYAALQLSIGGSNIPSLIDIINQMFDIDNNFRLKCIVERLLSSQLVDLSILRQILIVLNQDVRHYRQISVWIHCKRTLELILKMELDRITSNVSQLSGISTKPFLSMIRCCSRHLQFYLKDHICAFINVKSNLSNVMKEEYVAVVVKWIIKSSTWYEKRENFPEKLYEYIFTLLHNHRFPRVQKAVLNALYLVFTHFVISKVHVFMQDTAVTHLEEVISFYYLYQEDVIAVCLLVYGNCLLKLQKFEMSRNITNEVQSSLKTLFQTSPSELIYIRAAFCLIFVQHSIITCRTVSNWFERNDNITVEKRYDILLQQTLFKVKELVFEERLEKVVDYIQTHCAELLDRFVNEVYNYLCNKRRSHYLYGLAPNYLFIALRFSRRNFNVFHSAVQKSSFGEEKFKRELYLYFYYTDNSTDNKALAQLYAAFGVITIELIQMLPLIENDWFDEKWNYLERVKQVSDRGIIKKLFERLDLAKYDKESEHFSYVLSLLIQLAQTHVVSLLEVHQQVSLILNNALYKNNEREWNNEIYIFDLLLDLSCIKKITSWKSEKTLFSENDIEGYFEKEVQELEKKSALFLRRHYFLTNFRSVSNISN